MMPLARSFVRLLLLAVVVVPITPTAAKDDDNLDGISRYIYNLLDTRSFDHGSFSILASWVAMISICVGQYRQAVDLHDGYWNKTDERIWQARRAIAKAALETIFVFLFLMIGLAIVVPLSTKNLDERMAHIIQGFSMILSSFIQGFLSMRVGIWLNLYGHPFWTPNTTIFNKRLGTTIKELKYRVRWSVSKIILRSFPLLLVVFQGVDAAAIPLSIFLGLLFGVFVDMGVYLSRRWESLWCKNFVGICFVIILQVFALFVFTWGVFFIAAVWESNLDNDVAVTWDVYAFLAGVVILPLLHVLVWILGKRHSEFLLQEEQRKLGQEGIDEDGGSSKRSTGNGFPVPQARMVTSMILSDIKKMKQAQEKMVAEGLQKQNKMIETNETEEEYETAEPQQSITKKVGDGERDGKTDGELDNAADNQQQHQHELHEDEAKQDVREESPIPNEAVRMISPTQAASAASEVEQVEPTYWSLMMDWQWCGCARGDDKTTFHKVMNVIFWIAYLIMCAMCFFAFIVNAGATFQQDASREVLPFVAEVLYTDMDEGPVCAYDAALGKEGSNPTTFTDKDAAYAANYSILHCGACNHCSDWHNLELEYTTRKFLAQEGKNCAQKYVFGSGYEGLVECLEDPARIGWQGTCAICWADDIICTSDHCAMIGIQSFFINTLSNFQVGEDTITAASCEEAFCEADNPVKPAPDDTTWYGRFVECSGANRRRMNVTSSIARPGDQQCTIVDVDWAKLFPDLHPNDPDYKAS